MCQARPVTLFLSYAHKDQPFCQELKKHLRLLERQSLISAWYDWQIIAGTNWSEEIDKQLERASIILLLISADFLDSDYCYSQEMTRALQRQITGKARVIPILVRHCDWSCAPFAHLQVLPTNTRPISSWSNQDEAWVNVVTGIRLALAGQPIPIECAASIMPASTSTTPLLPSIHTPLRSTLEQQNRAYFLAKLDNSYRNLLHAFLQDAAQIALFFHSKPDAVVNSMHLKLRQANMQEYPLPAGTTLLHIFDETSGELLVLGNPGTGKTTQLLNLAEAICQRARLDEYVPLPVIVNLSTWAIARKPLATWLIEEIMESYKVPRGPIAHWLQQNQLLPLLDGLDEVNGSALSACIEAINTFKQQHMAPLVICCRTGEYDALPLQLALQNAVVIQPLEEGQVDIYFKAAGKSLAGIRSVLHKNAELRALVSTPLMLHVVTLAYQDVAVQDLPKKGTIQQQQQQIFHHYVERMLVLSHTRFSSQSMTLWLSWLARQMRTHNLTVFYLEHLQPEWLPLGRAQWLYDILAVRLYGALVGILVSILVKLIVFPRLFPPEVIWYGLTGGLVGGLICGGDSTSFQFIAIVEGWRRNGKRLVLLSACCAIFIGTSMVWVYKTWGGGLSAYWPIFGISSGLCAFLLSNLIIAGKRPAPYSMHLKQDQPLWTLWLVPGVRADHLLLGVVVGLLLGLSYWLSNGLSGGLSNGISDGLSASFRSSIIGILLSLLLLSSKRGIVLTETIGWSVNRLGQSLFSVIHMKRALRLFLLLSLSFGLITGLSVGPSFGLSVGLSVGLSASLIYWTLFGVWNNLSQEALDDSRRCTPNQGVRQSVHNGIILGLIAGVLCGLVAFLGVIFHKVLFVELNYWLSPGPHRVRHTWHYEMGVGPIVAIIAAFLVALLTGVLTGLRHLLLRTLLARVGQLPWLTVPFLDEATRCILLYRDGGGYRFIHRLLLEYFAELASSVPTIQSETQEQNDAFATDQEMHDATQ